MDNLIFVYIGQYGFKIIAALVIFFIGKWGIKRVVALIKKMMEKAEFDKTLIEFLGNVIYFALFIVIALAALNALGVNTTSFLAIFGAASLAVGLALKDSLSNIGAAVLIIVFRPFRVGDFVDIGNASGTVGLINLFSTIIATTDNKTIVIPNSSIIAGNIVNYSNNPTRRVDLAFNISYGDDLKLAKNVLLEVMQSDDRVLQDPPPFVAVGGLGDNSINLVFRVWVKTEHYWDVHFDMIEKVKLSFDANNISIPFPQMHIHTKGIK